MAFSSRRLSREYKTIEAMVRIFCNDRHQGGGRLCESCEELRAYAHYRLEKCPFGSEKPTCVNCKVHCYQAAMRERVREVMRYSGPKMVLRHPYLALMHILVDGKLPAPERKKRSRGAESGKAATGLVP